jgi:hypothetical protein
MNDVDIEALSSAEKLALAQRLLSALAADIGLPEAAAASPKKPLSRSDLSALQTSLATHLHSALKADPPATDWNAVRQQVLKSAG